MEALVPQDHLLRKVEKVMDYEWLYEKLDPYYCHDNGRPGIDPVVLIKMALIQHLFGIASLRQTYRDIIVNLAYRWFLGYGLLEEIPHFSTVSYAFCHRFPEDLTMEIFEHILNKALNNRMVDPRTVFIDGTHIKASANKKKYQKEQVAKAAKVYAEQLREEMPNVRSWGKSLSTTMTITMMRAPLVEGWLKRQFPQPTPMRECSSKESMNGSLHTKHTQLVIGEGLFLE